MQRDKGGLSRLGVLAGGLAERLRVGRRVEDVVDDLEGQAQVAARAAQDVELGLRRPGAEAAHDKRGLDHGRRLVQVDVLELGGRSRRAPLGEEVLHLPADQPLAARGVG